MKGSFHRFQSRFAESYPEISYWAPEQPLTASPSAHRSVRNTSAIVPSTARVSYKHH